MPRGRQTLILVLVLGIFLLACADAFAFDRYHNRQRKTYLYSAEAMAELERTITWQSVCFERYLYKENIETKEKTLIVDDYGQPTMCGDYDRVYGDMVTERVYPEFDPDWVDGNRIIYYHDGGRRYYHDGGYRKGNREFHDRKPQKEMREFQDRRPQKEMRESRDIRPQKGTEEFQERWPQKGTRK